jgi:Uma2 family endonuclease
MGTPPDNLALFEMADYLALEASSRYKHEFLAGYIYAVQGPSVTGMAGASAAHALIIGNLAAALRPALKGKDCRVFSTDMRLKIEAADAVFYPDVFVHCGPLNPQDSTLDRAAVVIEVLSKSTAQFDLNEKLRAYQLLDGLQAVIFISSTMQAISLAIHDTRWHAVTQLAQGERLSLPAIGLSLDWQAIYEDSGVV